LNVGANSKILGWENKKLLGEVYVNGNWDDLPTTCGICISLDACSLKDLTNLYKTLGLEGG